MNELLNQNRIFFLSAAFYIFAGFLLVSIFPLGTIEWQVYKLHLVPLNYFFSGITYLGDGWFLVAVLPAILLLVSPRAALICGLSVLITFICITILKHYIFVEAERPLQYFGDLLKPYLIPGMEKNYSNSFPSGHSGQAMALASSMALFVRKSSVRMVLLAAAILVAWSRVYLMQHFFVDTLAGSCIALLVTISLLPLKNKLSISEFWQKPLLTLKK